VRRPMYEQQPGQRIRQCGAPTPKKQQMPQHPTRHDTLRLERW
jgi:hypothetical protein